MIPAVDGGLAAMAADDGVAATTTTSHLRAAVAERVMATVASSGVMATAADRVMAIAVERVMAVAFNGVVPAMEASNSCRRAPAAERVVHVPRTPNWDAVRTTLRRGLCRHRGVASQLELSPDDDGVAERA